MIKEIKIPSLNGVLELSSYRDHRRVLVEKLPLSNIAKINKEELKAKIDRFKTADVERAVLIMAKMANDICFVRRLIERIDELEKEIERLKNDI